jgi:hypothetical protein
LSALFNCRSSLWFLTPYFRTGYKSFNRRHFPEIFDQLKRKSVKARGNPVPLSEKIHLMRAGHAWR